MLVGIAVARPESRHLYAWGLPPGSIRAILALLIFATTWGLLVLQPHREVPPYLRDLLFIVLGHYFASRRRAEAAEEPGPPPLYLPRGSVRLILVGGTLAVAALLHQRGQLASPGRHPGAVTLLLIGGFLLGVAWNALASRVRAGRPPLRIVEDLRALIAVAAAGLLVALVWDGLVLDVPRGLIDPPFPSWSKPHGLGPENALAAVVGFYFGSRS